MRLTETEMTPKDYFFKDQHYCVVLGSVRVSVKEFDGVKKVVLSEIYNGVSHYSVLSLFHLLSHLGDGLRLQDFVDAEEVCLDDDACEIRYTINTSPLVRRVKLKDVVSQYLATVGDEDHMSYFKEV